VATGVETRISRLWDRWAVSRLARFSRRDLGRMASLLMVGGLTRSRAASASQTVAGIAPTQASPAGSSLGASGTHELYASLGVRPFINCRGTVTVIGGSIELPEVRAVKSLANQQFVQMDELMEAAGQRLAELTGAEWGMVSAGCSAAIAHATAACIAGGNPDLHVRIPDLAGFPKDEAIIPAHSRTVYDAAIRGLGVKVIEVDSLEALDLAIGPKTALIYIRPNAENEKGPMPTEAIARIAKPHNVPVLVDAAAEALTIPVIHLQWGATLVTYSGGKIIRGPQSAGLLLGRKDLVKAAWVHSAPHHGYARAMKVGREEVVGMLAAVESWATRDHAAEWREWVARCDYIADRVAKIPGVTVSVRREPGHRNNLNARVSLQWDSQALGITGAGVARILDTTDPRILLSGTGRGQRTPGGDTTLSITTALMTPGDEKIVAERVHQVLSQKHTLAPEPPPREPAGNVSGSWKVDIQFAAGRSTHTLDLVQHGNRLKGTHRGDFTQRDVVGTIDGNVVKIASEFAEFHGDELAFEFSGTLTGDSMVGSLDMGEYLMATWSATRRA
jgi:L-seryl-tRNA(Ser) seleniumtransferase